jgi:hypothetical protein
MVKRFDVDHDRYGDSFGEIIESTEGEYVKYSDMQTYLILFRCNLEMAIKHDCAIEIEEIEAEVEGLRKDAERYRWMMKKHDGFYKSVDAMWDKYKYNDGRPSKEEFDAAIDAAMKETK